MNWMHFAGTEEAPLASQSSLPSCEEPLCISGLKSIYRACQNYPCRKLPFDLEGSFIQLYFGRKQERSVSWKILHSLITHMAGGVFWNNCCRQFHSTKLQMFLHKPLKVCCFVKELWKVRNHPQVSYTEFSQFLHDYHNRYSKYAFKAYNKEGKGMITTDEFCDLLTSVKVG